MSPYILILRLAAWLLARIFHIKIKLATKRRVRALGLQSWRYAPVGRVPSRGVQARQCASVGRVPSRGGRWCEISGLALLLLTSRSHAVLFRDTGDPTHNTTAPTGALTNSGWQYEGQWQTYFLGTPIAPHYFLSAQHIGGSVGNVFTLNGARYLTTAYVNSPDSDLRIWQVAQTFPSYAPLYTNLNAAGQLVVIIGCGTQRGAPVVVNGATNGWYWGASDYVQRWGENTVTASYDPYLYALFSETGPTNECAVSTGDSAGAWFIQQGGVWALAGITYATDGPFSTNCSTFPNNLSMLDERGLCDPDYYAVNYPVAVPSGFIASSVPNDLFWINSVIQPGGVVMTPITVSNFYNANEVVGTSTPLTATMFRGIYPQPDNDWAWYASGTPGLPAGGLPMGTTITSLAFTNTTFAFQPATATNNTAIISLNGGANPTNLTLTLSGTTAYSELAFLGANAGGGNPTYPAYTINYKGGGTQSGTLTLYNMGNPSSGVVGYDPGPYYAVSGGTYGNLGNDFALCQMNIVTTDATDPILSITLTASSYGGGNYEQFFALSGAAVPASSLSSTNALTSITRSGNNVNLTWTAGGGTYSVAQASPSLNFANLVDISGYIFCPGSSSAKTIYGAYTDVGGATNGSARYYRVYAP